MAQNCLNGAMMLNFVDGGHARRVRTLYSGGLVPVGTTGGFAQSCQNFVVEDCEFAYTERDSCPDGVGFDFEGDNENMTFRDNVVHHNDGAGILVMSTISDNVNIAISDNTFYANALDAYDPEHRFELLCHDVDNTGAVTNNGFYLTTADGIYSDDWDNFSTSDNRQGTYAAGPTSWGFDTDADFEGWSGLNHWGTPAVSGGALTGTASGIDPYIHSPALFVNSFEHSTVEVRMSVDAGTNLQVFYITDTDPVWNIEKSAFLPLVADGAMHDYAVDLEQADVMGVITQIRLDPTEVTGAQIAVDSVQFVAPL